MPPLIHKIYVVFAPEYLFRCVLDRINVSVDGNLLKEFDEAIKSHGYKTRSAAISEAMRDLLDKLAERSVLKMKVDRHVSA